MRESLPSHCGRARGQCAGFVGPHVRYNRSIGTLPRASKLIGHKHSPTSRPPSPSWARLLLKMAAMLNIKGLRSGRSARLALLGRYLSRSTLATKTSTATSLLFLVAILAVGTTALYSFRSKLLDVMVADQDRLLQRVADSQEQKLLSLQKALIQSASEIRDADVASSDAAQRYLDTNTGLYAGFDRSTFLFSDKGILLAERPYRPNRRGDNASW